MLIRIVIRCGCVWGRHSEIHFREGVTGEELDYWIKWRQSHGCLPLVSEVKALSKQAV